MRFPLLVSLLLFAALPSWSQSVVLPLWPHATPEPPQTTEPERDATKDTDHFISGHRTARFTNVVYPTMTVYLPPTGTHNTGAAAVVFPGGGYRILAWDGEGVDVCKWLNSIGMSCLLVKYRVPETEHYPENFADLEDAQQAMRMARLHAAEWHIDPNRIGAIGFSAGAHLTAVLGAHWDDTHVASTPAAPDVDTSISARPAFDLLGYPAYLAKGDELREIDPALKPLPETPPTFLLQNEDDNVHVENALVYYRALKDAKVPAEMHLFATGGHGFGLHPSGMPAEHWTLLATAWLRSLHIIPSEEALRQARRNEAPGNAPAGSMPCPAVIPQPGPRPTPQPPTPGTPNPNCP